MGNLADNEGRKYNGPLITHLMMYLVHLESSRISYNDFSYRLSCT